jgi:hypothetical protein
MRLLVLAFIAILSTASAAIAAPTCNDEAGRTVRCGAPGAMPLGWEPSPEVVAARDAAQPAGPSSTQMFGIVCFIGGLLALFAVLPDFEDERGGGWDRQEDDEA